MRIRIPERWMCREAEVTPEALYLRRRDFLRGVAVAGAGAAGALLVPGCGRAEPEPGAGAPSPVSADGFRTDEAATPFEAVTSYNNFYEFGTDKERSRRATPAPS